MKASDRRAIRTAETQNTGGKNYTMPHEGRLIKHPVSVNANSKQCTILKFFVIWKLQTKLRSFISDRRTPKKTTCFTGATQRRPCDAHRTLCASPLPQEHHRTFIARPNRVTLSSNTSTLEYRRGTYAETVKKRRDAGELEIRLTASSLDPALQDTFSERESWLELRS